MPIELGHVEAIFIHRVKSMRGERVETATLGWHGLEGDRRLALRRIDDRTGFPWLSATKLPDLIRFTPLRRQGDGNGELATHVLTPEGREMAVFSRELDAEITGRHGAPVEVTHLRQGVFDEASLSVLASDTIDEIARLAGIAPDVRRFRPNVLVRPRARGAFQEDAWVGGVLAFGTDDEAPSITVTMRDIRCSMVNYDPDTARSSPEVLKAITRVNGNTAGVYGTVIRSGPVAVGQPVFLLEASGPGVRDRIAADSAPLTGPPAR